MTPFLYRIAQAFYKKYGNEISRLAFVFPNRRSGIFFQKYLAEVSGKPIFSPKVTTINDLMAELSPYALIDRISLLVTLYKKYIELRKSDETFDNFVFWGDMLLGDFDDVDKYMVDARQLFTNIHDLKEIDEFYLTEEQIEIVKRFWGHLFFLPPKAIINSNSFNCGKFFSIFIPDYEMSYPLETKPMKAWYSETSPNGVNGKKLSTYLIHKWYSSDSTLSPKPKKYSWNIYATSA